jgi:hypothetical protein
VVEERSRTKKPLRFGSGRWSYHFRKQRQKPTPLAHLEIPSPRSVCNAPTTSNSHTVDGGAPAIRQKPLPLRQQVHVTALRGSVRPVKFPLAEVWCARFPGRGHNLGLSLIRNERQRGRCEALCQGTFSLFFLFQIIASISTQAHSLWRI